MFLMVLACIGDFLHFRFMPTRPFLAVGTAYQKKAAFHAEAAGRLILLGLGMSPDDGPPGKGGAPGATATGGSGGGDPKNKSKGGNTAAASSAAGGAATSTTTTKNAYERTCSDPCMVMEYAFELDLNAPCSAICQVLLRVFCAHDFCLVQRMRSAASAATTVSNVSVRLG